MTGLRRTLGLGLAAATAAGALTTAPAALADYGPAAEAASANGTRLGSGPSRSASISDDGRYVVFDTEAPELLGAPADAEQWYARGLVRRDLQTGAVQLVAPPQRRSADGPVADGAFGFASISGNGRFVAFKTTEALAPSDHNGTGDVYVRDMDRPVTDGHAYELASALDGSDLAPDYVSGGSDVGPLGFALSDDGRSAAFFTSGVSNLPAGGDATTPANQVFVRRLDAHRTIAITAPVDGHRGPNPIISGDGSTVVWVDGNAAAQTRLLPGEPNPAATLLWRRVDGGDARRVGGATDLDDSTCDPATPFAGASITQTGPCYGPFVKDIGTDVGEISAVVAPASISDDGLRVLLVSTAMRRPYDAVTARTSGSLYVADMRAGVPRKVGVTRPISLTNGGEITGAVLSGDGRHVVLATSNFAFDGPRVIGTLPSSGYPTTDLWVADLDAASVQRATRATDGGDYHGAPVDPESPNTFNNPSPTGLAVDDAAHTLAFSANDGNLFVGDANSETDVEVIRGATGAATAVGAVTALPVPGSAEPVVAQSFPPLAAPRAVHPVIGYATVGRDGIARVTVRVPAAGTLTGDATTKSGKRTARVAQRAKVTAKSAKTITLRFNPSKTMKKRLRSRAVKATIAIRYAPKAGTSTSAKRTVTFPRRKATR